MTPAVGIAYRGVLHDWIVANEPLVDILELTIDHWFWTSDHGRRRMREVAAGFPMIGHGIGLSIGTEAPLDLAYVDRVARVVETLGLRTYSEHLAFTRAGGIDTANLLPLPRTEAMAERIVERIRAVRSIIAVPFQLENITRYVDWPESALSEAAFFDLIQRETGIGILLDVENVRVNATNRGRDPFAEADQFAASAIAALHVAGGSVLDGHAVDSHDHPVPDETLRLLGHVLGRAQPATVVLERDGRYGDREGIRADMLRLRRAVAASVEAVA